MVGEAPGEVEDMLGLPFMGPSGRVFNEAIRVACEMANLPQAPRYFITNTVGCRPCDEKDGPNREPQSDEIWKCFERLRRTWSDCKPKRVVLLGKIAQRAFKTTWPDAATMVHPAYILRLGGIGCPAFRGLARDLSKVFHDVSVL